MSDERGEMRESTSPTRRPWTEVFRAFQIALDPSKLILATAAVVVLWLGWWILGLVFGQSDSAYSTWPGYVNRGKNPFIVVTHPSEGHLFSGTFWFGGEGQQPPAQVEPFQKFFGPVIDVIRSSPREGKWWYALFGLFYSLAVWSIFGGAITRIAAVQVARREKLSMSDGIRFARQKFWSFFTAPLIPLLGIAGLGILMVLGGLLLHIPLVGDWLVAILWFLPLIAGLIIALLVIGYIGWPLMYATVSAEGTDSFDALSRCYAYVYQRPWQYLLYAFLAILYGFIAVFFMVFMTSFMVYLAKWGVELIPWHGWRGDPLSTLFIYAPTSYEWCTLLGGDHKDLKPEWFQKFAAGIVAIWLHIIFLFVLGFAYSFFWSAGTVVYFLMRKLVDDTDLDEVYLEDEDVMVPFSSPMSQEPNTLPISGGNAPAPAGGSGGNEPPVSGGGTPGEGGAPPSSPPGN